jgi:hypothetical protein
MTLNVKFKNCVVLHTSVHKMNSNIHILAPENDRTWTQRYTYSDITSLFKHNSKKQEMIEPAVTTSSKISPIFGFLWRSRSRRGEHKYSCISTDRYHDSTRHCG